MTRGYFRVVCAIEILVIVAILVLSVLRGELHVDEAGYVYAANQIAEGRIPYHDFFFLQTPVFPTVFAIPWTILDVDFLYARSYMMLFGLATVLLSMVIAFRLGGRNAVLLVGLLFCATPFQLRFFSIARMYPLATFWLCAGVIFMIARDRAVWRSVMAMFFFTLAFSTRLTLLPVPFLYCCYLIWSDGIRSRRLLAALSTGAITVFIINGPFLALDPERFFYNIIGFHLDITVGGYLSGMVHKLAGLSRLISAYFIAFLCSFLALFLVILQSDHPIRKSDSRHERDVLLFLVSVVLVVGAGHFTAKFFQESYQTILFPFLAIATAVVLARTTLSFSERRSAIILTLTLAMLVPIGLIANGRSGFVFEEDRANLKTAQHMAEQLSRISQPGDHIMSSDSPMVPVLAGHRVMTGFEGPEYFPYWSDERARHFRVVNQRLLLKLIHDRIPDIILVNTQSFALVMPTRTDTPAELRREIFEALDSEYVLYTRYPHLFSLGEESRVYVTPTRAKILGVTAVDAASGEDEQ